MTNPQLGRLEQVDLREAWATEAGDHVRLVDFGCPEENDWLVEKISITRSDNWSRGQSRHPIT